MKKVTVILLVSVVGAFSFAKGEKNSRKPAQVAEKKISCMMNGTGKLNGANIALNSTLDTIIGVNRVPTDIKFSVIGNVNRLETNDKLAQNDCEPDTYDSTDVMKVSVNYKGTVSEGWLLCRTTGHGIYDGSRNCDKRPY